MLMIMLEKTKNCQHWWTNSSLTLLKDSKESMIWSSLFSFLDGSGVAPSSTFRRHDERHWIERVLANILEDPCEQWHHWPTTTRGPRPSSGQASFQIPRRCRWPCALQTDSDGAASQCVGRSGPCLGRVVTTTQAQWLPHHVLSCSSAPSSSCRMEYTTQWHN